MIARPHLAVEWLEPRRLLASDAPLLRTSDTPAEMDLIGGQTGGEDIIVAPTRTPIYPPLAPTMWIEASIGSFELPEAVTVAFFAPDEPSEEFLGGEDDDPESTHPQHATMAGSRTTSGATSGVMPVQASITQLMFDMEQSVTGLDGGADALT